ASSPTDALPILGPPRPSGVISPPRHDADDLGTVFTQDHSLRTGWAVVLCGHIASLYVWCCALRCQHTALISTVQLGEQKRGGPETRPANGVVCRWSRALGDLLREPHGGTPLVDGAVAAGQIAPRVCGVHIVQHGSCAAPRNRLDVIPMDVVIGGRS